MRLTSGFCPGLMSSSATRGEAIAVRAGGSAAEILPNRARRDWPMPSRACRWVLSRGFRLHWVTAVGIRQRSSCEAAPGPLLRDPSERDSTNIDVRPKRHSVGQRNQKNKKRAGRASIRVPRIRSALKARSSAHCGAHAALRALSPPRWRPTYRPPRETGLSASRAADHQVS